MHVFSSYLGGTNHTRARFKSAVKIVGLGNYQIETKKQVSWEEKTTVKD